MSRRRYQFEYARGWLAYRIVMAWPLGVFDYCPGRLLAWAGFYAYDDRHMPPEMRRP